MKVSGPSAWQPSPAGLGDLPAIRRLLTLCGLEHADLTADHLPLFCVLRVGGELVGVAGLEAHDAAGLVRSLAVRPDCRGRGAGALLVSAVEEAALRSGVRDLYLLTQTARQFFVERGYQDISREEVPMSIRTGAQFVHLCPASAACLHKRLTPGNPG